jgi:GNAT superfamily N-acetyltransferase
MRINEKRVRIRHAQMNNYKRIFELLAELGRPSPKDEYEYQKFKSHIEDYIDSKNHNHSILVATIGSEIVGLVSYILLYRLNQRFREFWIPELVISREYRGQGIGKLLIHKCESIAKRKHCYRMRLESGNDRIESHEFYKKVGFKQMALTFAKRL